MKFGGDKTRMYKAYEQAQELAFAPMMFQAVRSLRETGILTYLNDHEEGATEEQLSKAVDLSPYMVRILCEAGAASKTLMHRDETFYLAKTGYLLLTDELSKRNMNFIHDVCYKGMFHFQEAVETGTPAGLKELGDWPTVYEGLAELTPEVQKSWFEFDHYYSDNAFNQVLPLIFEKEPKKVLDVGGNTGRFACKLLGYNSSAEVTILDHPGQLAMAKENATKQGFGGRLFGEAMDLLDHTTPFPTQFNAVWMSQFLDCFPPSDIINLMRRGKNALAQGGSLYVMEPFIDRQTHEQAKFSLIGTSLYFTAIANGTSRMYHASEMIEYAKTAGLTLVDSWDELGEFQTLLRFEKTK